MSNPYTSVTLTGYNADTPPDDGTRTAANQLTWSKHKTKIGDPLKVFVEAMNANVLAAFAKSFGNTVTAVAANYSITVADAGKFLSVAGERTLTLPPVATAGSIFTVTVLNLGTSVVTVDGDAAELVNGLAAIYIGPGESAILSCDGAAWTAVMARAFPNRIQTKATDYTLLVSDTGNWIEFTAQATLTMLAVATAGANFRFGVLNNGSAGVTLDPAGVETINGSTSLVIFPGEQAMLACDGAEWYAVVARASTQKVKTADESVSLSTTLQSDDHLAGFQLAANSYYEIEGYIEAEGDASVGGKIALTFTNAPQDFHISVVFGSLASAIASTASASGGEASIGLSGVGVKAFASIRGMVRTNATTGGTVDLQWAQQNSDAVALVFGQGSWLKFTPIRT